jgi:AraC family transcriptional activator of pobA
MSIVPAVPVFQLYGESQAWPTPDLLHCETIPKRSRLHQWQIQPHQHADLCQLVYLHRGQAWVEIEGHTRSISGPMVQVIPPLCVHGFAFSPDVDGYVLTLAAPLVSQLQAQMGPAMAVFTQPQTYSMGQERRALNRLFSTLHQEYQGSQPAREVMLRSLVSTLWVWIGRQCLQRRVASQAPSRGQAVFSRFMAQVERDFRSQPSTEQLAHALGVSVAYLNTLCRQLAGQTALQILHQRLLLEARRQLIYTRLSIQELALGLGFVDPAYFARFFRRLAGVSPSTFRLAAE